MPAPTAPESSRAARVSGSLVRALTHGAAIWWILALLAWLLGRWIDSSALRETLLPEHERHTVVARELALLAAAAWGGGTLLALLAYGLGGRVRSRGGRALGWALVTLSAAAALGLYSSSWIAFHSTGRFLDTAGILFMSANPRQFFQHVAHIEPFLLLTAPALLLGGAVLLSGGLAALVVRLGRPASIGLVAATALAVAVCSALGTRALDPDFPTAEFVMDPEAGMVYTYRDLYDDCRDDRAGPLSHALAEVSRRWLRHERRLYADPSIVVVERPIVSMDQYVADVDREKLERWNVVLVIVESLRPDQLMVFGSEREVMPNVEALAREGLAFSDHYAQASHSNYADLCPLSSHYPLRSRRVHLYPKNPTYPRVLIYDVLKALGWHTAIVSSQNEVWGQMINYLQTGSVDHFFHSESFDGPTYVPRNDTGFEDFLKGSKRSGKIDDRFTVDEAIRWIGTVDDGAPFFLYLNLQNSHLPYETPADFPRRFGPEHLPFRITFGGFPRDQVQLVKDVYADSLAYSDHQLGRLIDFLKERGEWDRTLVVVTGDTGQAFYEHGFVAHANRIFEELMRVPLVIRAPGAAPKLDDRPAQQIDIAPTVLDLLGLPPHPSFQGVSLVGDTDLEGRSRYLMVQAPLAHQFGIVQGNFKLIDDLERDHVLLLNLRQDPHETRDISGRRPQLTDTLLRRLDTWRKQQLDYYADPGRHTRTYPPVLKD